MTAFPQPDPTDVAAYDEALRHVVVGEPKPLTAPVGISDHDPEWRREYEREAGRIRSALGERVEQFDADAKRELAARDWKYGQQYADAKTAVVSEIMARAEAWNERGRER